MTDDADADPADVARLVAAARELGDSIAAVELQWELDDDDARPSWRLDVCAIVRRSGPFDSRYRSEALAGVPAEEPGDRARAEALARAVATALEVDAEIAGLAVAGGRSGSRWIERQGEAPVVAYAVRWALYTWSDEGERRDLEGERIVEARSGRDAEHAVTDALEERYRATARPVYLSVAVRGEPRRGWSHRTPELSRDATPAEELRRWHREGRSVGAIVRDLSTATTAPSPLTVMMSLERAFGLPVHYLGAVAAWRAGRIGLAELDAALDTQVVAMRPAWDRPRRLRDARARGESLAALLRREEGGGAAPLALIVALRDTFGIGLADAENAVARLGEDDDAAIDRDLDAAIEHATVN